MADPCLLPSPRIDLTLSGSPGALTADIIPSGDPYNGVDLRADGLWTPDRPPLVIGSLPAAPADGDEIYFMADPTADAAHRAQSWHLRYDASESTAYKWKFLGGFPLFAKIPSAGTIAPSGSNSWNTLAGTDVAGPSVTLPLGGYYLPEFGAQVAAAGTSGLAQVGVSVQGVDPSTDDVASNGYTNGASVTGDRDPMLAAYTAGQVLRLMYRDANSTGTATFARRWLKVTPVKVG